MSRAIRSILIALVIFQQVFCHEEFQRLVIERLEKLEKENVRLGNENRQLKTRLEVYENSMSQMTENMQKIDKDVTDLKSNLTHTITDLIEDTRKGINECHSINPCQNNGTCVDLEVGFKCQCPIGITGLTCEENINDCLRDHSYITSSK